MTIRSLIELAIVTEAFVCGVNGVRGEGVDCERIVEFRVVAAGTSEVD